MKQETIRGFQLPRGTRTYNGTTKPEDWINDYLIAVFVAGVDRNWVARYVPQMLEGTIRIWLNNLEPGSIRCWTDFEEAFNNNFASTYKRPNRSQQLADC